MTKIQPKKAPYILIVDDDEDDQHFLTSAIFEMIPGATVKSLYDGTEAVNFLKDDPENRTQPLPDLIFLDINMNKLCGKKTTGFLKQDLRAKNIPIVIFTTASSEDQKLDMLRAGADDFYTKPYNIRDLKAIVLEIQQKWLRS